MNTPVSFPIAKLLKEKDYGNTAPWKLRRDYYNHLGELNGDVTDYIRAFVKLKNRKNRDELTHLETIDAPTIAEVVMWLYEKKSLWILALPTVTGHFAYKILDVQLDPKNPIERPPYKDVSANDYDTPTEAYEAGIEYCLNNLV